MSCPLCVNSVCPDHRARCWVGTRKTWRELASPASTPPPCDLSQMFNFSRNSGNTEYWSIIQVPLQHWPSLLFWITIVQSWLSLVHYKGSQLKKMWLDRTTRKGAAQNISRKSANAPHPGKLPVEAIRKVFPPAAAGEFVQNFAAAENFWHKLLTLLLPRQAAAVLPRKLLNYSSAEALTGSGREKREKEISEFIDSGLPVASYTMRSKCSSSFRAPGNLNPAPLNHWSWRLRKNIGLWRFRETWLRRLKGIQERF